MLISTLVFLFWSLVILLPIAIIITAVISARAANKHMKDVLTRDKASRLHDVEFDSKSVIMTPTSVSDF